MAVGKQAETIIVHWHPGDSTGSDGLGRAGASIPSDKAAADVATEATARAAVNTRVSTLSARLVASGTLPVGV